MDADSILTTAEMDAELAATAREEIDDPRIRWVVGDGRAWIEQFDEPHKFDLIFADTWPGKFSHLNETLALVKPGGICLIDDLLPQANWPQNHQRSVDELIDRLRLLTGWHCSNLDWSSGA